MLNENLKKLRTKKGYSQETLAGELNVVRQTISKWEKGISVPDAEMLSRIAEIFEVPISELLGSNIVENESEDQNNAIANQLAILNEQLAKRGQFRKKIWKIIKSILIIILIIIALYIVIALIGMSLYISSPKSTTTNEILYNEKDYIVDSYNNI